MKSRLIGTALIFAVPTAFSATCCESGNTTMSKSNGCCGAELSCKLTSPELQKRKATVIAELKAELIEKKELPDGYAFAFPGTDAMLDRLNDFIKTERQCCDFFSFNLRVGAAGKPLWLELTGSGEVKQFITAELGL